MVVNKNHLWWSIVLEIPIEKTRKLYMHEKRKKLEELLNKKVRDKLQLKS